MHQRLRFTEPLPDSDNVTRQTIHSAICRAFGAPTTVPHIPVDNPVSMDLSNIDLLRRDEYYVAFKADGVRNLLVLIMAMVDGQHRPVAALVDRAGHMVLIDVLANLLHFENEMVLDGELCFHERENRSDFLVFNVLSGKLPLCKDTYAKRLETMARMVIDTKTEDPARLAELGYVVASNPQLSIRRKMVESARNLRTLVHHHLTPNFKHDGFIFTPNTKVTPGRQSTLLKWKTDNTIDVAVKSQFDGTNWGPMQVLLDDDGQMIDMGTALRDFDICFDTSTELFCTVLAGFLEYHRIFGSPDDHQPVFSYIVEVSCTPAGRGFTMQLERLRPDKSGPNNVTTVKRTIRTIHDNITLPQIYATIESFYAH